MLELGVRATCRPDIPSVLVESVSEVYQWTHPYPLGLAFKEICLLVVYQCIPVHIHRARIPGLSLVLVSAQLPAVWSSSQLARTYKYLWTAKRMGRRA